MELLFDNAIQFQAKNGTLLTGGRVYVYYLGRTELAPVYSGYSGGTPISNPVKLDAEGRGSIYVDPAFSYTYVVTDRFGKEQFSIDKEFKAGIPTEGTYITRIVGGDYIKVEETGDRAKTVTVGVDDKAKDILDNAVNKKYVDDEVVKAKTTLKEGNNIKLNLDVKEDGHFEYTINAKNIDVTSPNGTITVNVVDDPLTDTKTFQLDIESGKFEYFFGKSLNISVTDDRQYELVAMAIQNVQGSLDPASLKKGIYLMCATVKYLPVSNTNDMQKVTIKSGYPAIEHYDVLDMSFTDYRTKELAQLLVIPNDGIPATIYFQLEGMTEPGREVNVELYNVSIYRIDGIFSNGGEIITGLTEVIHDDTLTGKGTNEEPLSVVSSGTGTKYTSGNGIYVDSDNVINVMAGNGLEFTTDNKLQVKLGKGLKFDTEAGIEGEISIDDIGQEVIEQVLELSSELDKKITTTFNYAQITTMADFAPYGVQGTTRLIGQLFAVPIASEIRLNETLISVRAQQGYAGNLSFGIFEFDFDGNDGTGSTTWLCDTGVVRVNAGENMLPVKHIVSTSVSRPTIKMEPGKLYYATILIDGAAPASGLYLASCEPYNANYNATPKYTLVASNMDSYVDWSNGSQEATWFQGYNEFHDIPRLFMMIRNGEAAPPIPTVDPFNNYSEFTLNGTYKYRDIFGLDFNGSNYPVAYQKIIPQVDVTVTDIGYCDMEQGLYDSSSDIPLVLDNSYTSIVNVGSATCTIGNNDGYTIDGTRFYHQFKLNTPLKLTTGTIYWVPVSLNISNGKDDTFVTYGSPNVTKDVIVFTNKWNINQWAIGDGSAEFKSAEPAPMTRIIDENNKEYTF